MVEFVVSFTVYSLCMYLARRHKDDDDEKSYENPAQIEDTTSDGIGMMSHDTPRFLQLALFLNDTPIFSDQDHSLQE